MNNNRAKGERFTDQVRDYLESEGYSVFPEYEVEVGINSLHKKKHRFDLGNESLLVECKAYDWTESRRNPSAKLATANEAMMYFGTVPGTYQKKMFFLKTEKNGKRNPETLGEYYVRTYKHMIPDDVEIYEFSIEGLSAELIWPYSSKSESAVGQKQSAGNATAQESEDETLDDYPVMHLKLGKAFYSQGFFNVTVRFNEYVRKDQGEITLVLDEETTIVGRVDRHANRNGTPRIIGRTPLRDWFQRHYQQGDVVPVRFDSPYQVTLG